MRCSRDITQFSSHLRFWTEVLNVVRTLNYYKVNILSRSKIQHKYTTAIGIYLQTKHRSGILTTVMHTYIIVDLC